MQKSVDEYYCTGYLVCNLEEMEPLLDSKSNVIEFANKEDAQRFIDKQTGESNSFLAVPINHSASLQ